MKTCPKCGQSGKPTYAGRRVCKDCLQSAMRARLDQIRVFINTYKENMACMDCDVYYPAPVMQFDHRPDTEKSGNVSDMVNNECSLKTILKEISKCDLVCSNCHAIRTNITRKPPVEGALS